MKKSKYPIILQLVASLVCVEAYGQVLRIQESSAQEGTVKPGILYVCQKIEDLRHGTPEDVPTFHFTVHTESANVKEEPPRQFETVDKSYFDDAVFIGDSRMVGLHDYSGLDNATYYAEVGMTIFSLFDKPVAKLADGSMGTIEQALQQKQFGKVYLMVGINELGTGTQERFLQAYQSAVERIQSLQPDAVIFVQGIMYVTEERSKGDAYINNPNIQVRNKNISTLADNRNIFYIDVNEIYSDGKGNLSKEYTFDNAHLKGACYGPWVQFLMEHGIVK